MLPDNLLVPALNVLLLSVVVALLSLLAASCMRSMVRRHAVLVTGLVACLVLPLPVAIGWSLSLGRLPDLAVRGEVPVAPAVDVGDEIAPAVPAMAEESSSQAGAAVPHFDMNAGAQPRGEAPTAETSAAFTDHPANEAVPAAASPANAPASWRDRVRLVGAAAIIIWCAGTLIMGVRLGIGLVRVRRLLRLCAPCDDAFVDRTVAEIASELGIDPVPGVLQAAGVPAPVVVGLRRPAVILSKDAAALLTRDQLRAVLLHECAHIRRGDHTIVALQAAAGVIYWWNPLMHMISRSIARVRELICDDAVIVSGGTSRSYAQSIVMLAERACAVPQPLSKLGISMSSAGELEQRVRRILSAVARESQVRASAPLRMIVVGIATLAVFGLLALQFPAANGTEAHAAPAAHTALADDASTTSSPPSNAQDRVVIVVTDGDGSPIEGAWVAVRFESEFLYLPPILTDADGRAVHDYPADERIQDLIAWKDGAGIAHAGFRRADDQRMNLRGERPEVPRDEPFHMTLRGASPLTVRVQDVDGAPVPSVRVIPSNMWGSSFGSDVRLDLTEKLQMHTGADGTVTLGWIDSEATQIAFIIFPTERSHAPKTWERIDLPTGAESAVVTVERLVPLTGRVLGMDGTPMSGVQIHAIGHSAFPNPARFDAVTDEEGRYAMRVDPNRAYVVVPRDAQWAAEPRSPIVILPDERVDGIDFVVRPATRIRGLLVHRMTGQPIANQSVAVYRSGDTVMAHRDLGLDMWDGRDAAMQLSVGPIRASSNDDGVFEMALGDGRYRVGWPLSDPPVQFVVAGEEVIELRLESVRDGFHDFHGRVVMEAGGAPAEGVRVTGQRRLGGRGEWNAVTDADGSFHVQRDDHVEIIHGITRDRQQVGIAVSPSIDEPFELALAESATIVGRIVRDADGKPLVGERVSYQVVWPDDPQWLGMRPLYGQVMTNEDGRFEIDGVAPGWAYRVSYDRSPRSFLAFNVVLEPGEIRDLSTFRRDVPLPQLLIFGPQVHSETGQVRLNPVEGVDAVHTARTPMLSLADLTGARLAEQTVTENGQTIQRSVLMLEVEGIVRSEILAMRERVADGDWLLIATLDGRVISASTMQPPANYTEAGEIPLVIADEEDLRILMNLISAQADARK